MQSPVMYVSTNTCDHCKYVISVQPQAEVEQWKARMSSQQEIIFSSLSPTSINLMDTFKVQLNLWRMVSQLHEFKKLSFTCKINHAVTFLKKLIHF